MSQLIVRLLICLPCVLVGQVVAADFKDVQHGHWTNEYDNLFRKYTKHYFGPHIDWHWFKAQGIAESGLKPGASSVVGAKGIMQILPSTYKDIIKRNPFLKGIDDPKWNIAAGIFYDRQLYRKWRKKPVANQERLSFAFASYNAGYGGALKAYKKAKNEHGKVSKWSQVENYAPNETKYYVRRIDKLMFQRK